MRVVHVSDTYLPSLGGIELHLRDLVQAQRARGDDVALITTTAAGPGAHPLLDPSWVHRVHRHEVRERLRALAPDVVHAHASVVSPVALGTARRAARDGLPTLVTVHSMWDVLGPVPAAAAGLGALAAWPVAWSAVSRAAAQTVSRVLGGSRPVHVLANAVDADLWRAVDRPGAQQDDPPPTVISVMRLTRTKRALPLVGVLADVRRRLPDDLDWRAVVVGSGPDAASVRRRVHRLGLDDRVELVGSVTRSEVRRRVGEAGVFLAPARRESFGIAALEARTAGLPVVASSHGGVGEFVADGVEGFLADDDAGLADAVARLLGDPALRTRMTRHNRAVAPRCTWEQACADARVLYDEAARVAVAPRRGRVALA